MSEPTRERILRAAIRLFPPRGYHGTGLSEILADAGLNYRAFALLPLRNALRGGDYMQLDVELFSPLVVTPVAGFYVGLGPYVHFAYAIGGDFFQPLADNWLVTFGISTLLGAWL